MADSSRDTHAIHRRTFLKQSAVVAAGFAAAPHLALGDLRLDSPLTRPLGRTGFAAATLGLGGQASLQWTPPGVDPVAIVLKALERGVNYIDTSNVYGPSQQNLGAAFRRLHLVPGRPGYDEKRRRSLFVATKTMLRWGKLPPGESAGRTNGPPGSRAADDVRRSLSLMFGDGKGGYPRGAYLDCVQIHMVWSGDVVDAIYHGLDRPDPAADRIGALAVLRDLRDGTNLTGLNPGEEKLIRHIGLTGHSSSPVLIDCLLRDDKGIFDTLLVALNPLDRKYLNHQYNVIPVARARGMGVIGMKVFADGAMYGKPPGWTRDHRDLILQVGSPRLPSRPLIEYTLSTPGVDIVIVGIGHIDPDPERCQLERNLADAQVEMPLDDSERRRIEALVAEVTPEGTNWFQRPREPLGPPRRLQLRHEYDDGRRRVRLVWHTAIASDEPIVRYDIIRDGRRVAQVPHRPQVSYRRPFRWEETVTDRESHVYTVATVDAAGRIAASEEQFVPGLG